MSEPTPSSSASASPTPAADASGAASSSSSGAAPVAATRPEFLPEQYWDAQAGSIKTDDFAKHYVELTAAQKLLAERAAAVPKDVAGYKPEVKLPDGVKVPDGMKFDPAKDPRLPTLLNVAHARGWSNDDVNALVALDAEMMIASHGAEQARLAEETKKLGEKATDRISAVTAWAKGLADKGDLTAAEHAEIRMTATTAAGVTLIEKLMAKANGAMPGHTPPTPPKPEPKSHAERIWPGGFSPTPQARAI